MKFCENIYCEQAQREFELKPNSHYRILDGAIVCVACYELEQDLQEELEANQPDYDYELQGSFVEVR